MTQCEAAAVVALWEPVVAVVPGRPPYVPAAVAVTARPACPRLPLRRSGRKPSLAKGPVACPVLTCLACWLNACKIGHSSM